MITIQHLQIIDGITGEGSVTKAAEKLHLTQSAVSHQIRDLEHTLGLKLFHRSGKKMILTEAGRQVLKGAGAILPALEELQTSLANLKTGRSQTLRISTECYTCYNWLPGILQTFHKKHPGVQVEIVVQATQKPLEYLEAGKLDLAIVSRLAANTPFRYEPLFDDELVVVTHPQHALAKHKQPLHAADLQEETLLLYSFSGNSGLLPEEFFQEAKPRHVMKVPLTEAIIEMVKAGIGITVMANWAARQYVSRNNLALLPLGSRLRKRRWYACSHKDAEAPLQQLVQLIQEKISAGSN